MMDQEESDIELIENFFSKTLTPEETLRFNERIKADPDFAQKADEYKEIINGIKLQAKEDFQKEVAGWETEIRNESHTTKQLSWKPYLSIAAAVLVLFLVGIYFFSTTYQPKNEQQLFATYFTAYEDVISVRSGTSEKTTLEQAMLLYNEERYQEATPYFKNHIKSNKNDISALFYLAISNLALKNTEEAILNLQFIIKQNAIFHDQAEWYLCLAYLAKNDDRSALEILKKITHEPEHIFQKQALKLLQELD